MTMSADAASPVARAAPGNGWSRAAIGLALLVALPMAVVAAHVVVPEREIWRHLVGTVLPGYVWTTLVLATGVGTGVLLVGTGAAWLVTMCRFPGRRQLEWALLLPLAIPAYVIAYTYTGLLDYAGPVQHLLRALTGWGRRDYWFPEIRSLAGAIAMMTLVLYPYVYLLARAAFLEQSVCALEVARTLGRGPWRSFFTVALPLARPALAAGVTLAVMETLNDFGTVQFFAVDTLTAGIFRTWHGLGQPAAAAQLAALLLVVALVVPLVERWTRGRARFHHTTGRYRDLPGYALVGWRGWLAAALCALPVVLGFVVPAGVLTHWAIQTAPDMIDARFAHLAWNSFALAGIASVVATALAVVMAYGHRLGPGPAMTLAHGVAGIGYAIPGAVIAIGVIVPLAAFDHAADRLLGTGLLLSGTLVAVQYAYVVRFMAVALNTVEASLGKVTASMDNAARLLGRGPAGVLAQVHLPIIRPSLLTAALLVFVDVMKELPATLILRPFNFDTLAIRANELARDERLADASNAALAIVLVGIGPVLVLSRAIAHARPGHARLGRARPGHARAGLR